MKSHYYCMLLFTCLLCPLVTGSESTMNTLQVRITAVSVSGSISVEMRNASHKSLRIWRESNSWGAAHWRVMLLRNNRLQTFYQNPNQGFTINIPTCDELAGYTSIKKELDINDEVWCRLDGKKVNFEQGDSVIVIYDVPRVDACTGNMVSMKAYEMNVWYGVVADHAIVKTAVPR